MENRLIFVHMAPNEPDSARRWREQCPLRVWAFGRQIAKGENRQAGPLGRAPAVWWPERVRKTRGRCVRQEVSPPPLFPLTGRADVRRRPPRPRPSPLGDALQDSAAGARLIDAQQSVVRCVSASEMRRQQ
jgi:hypothetical protein